MSLPAPLLLPYGERFPEIADSAFIAPRATVIGDVVIGPKSSVWFGCTLRGDVNSIRIGARSNIQDGTVIHVTRGGHATHIGDDVLVGHTCIIHACTLESGSFVGMGATVMDGAVVESGAMVAAGALVTPGKRVPRGELWAGNPAKFKRPLSEEEMAGFKAQTDHYVRMAESYLELLAGR